MDRRRLISATTALFLGVPIAGCSSDTPRRDDDFSSTKWETMNATLPSPREGGASFSDGDYLYVCGGSYNDSQSVTDKCHRYDPSMDSFESIAPLPNAKRYPNGFFDPKTGRGYVIGGQTSSGRNFREAHYYDKTKDRWVAVNDSPVPTSRSGTFFVDGKAYLLGVGGPTNVLEYDPSADSYREVASMDEGVSNTSGTYYGSFGYKIGGHMTDGSIPNDRSTKTERYDPTTDSWTTVSSYSVSRSHTASTSDDDGNIYHIGGWDGVDTPQKNQGEGAYDTVEMYDTSEDSWSKIDSLPTDLRSPHAYFHSKHIYVIGGWNTYLGDGLLDIFNPHSSDNSKVFRIDTTEINST